jgi:hypothetical protein
LSVDLLPKVVASFDRACPQGLGDHLGNPKTISTRLGERAFARFAYINSSGRSREGAEIAQALRLSLQTFEESPVFQRRDRKPR